MFDLLSNFLLLLLVLALFVWGFQSLPKEAFRYLGLFLFFLILVVGLINFPLAAQPIPKTLIDILTLPLTAAGFVLVAVFFNWRKAKSIRSNKDVDNRSLQRSLRQGLLWAWVVLALLANNGVSDLLVAYLEVQGENAVVQSFRRNVLTLGEGALLPISLQQFDVIVVLSGGTLALPPPPPIPATPTANWPTYNLDEDSPWNVRLAPGSDRLLQTQRLFERHRRLGLPLPLVVLSGGTPAYQRDRARPNNYPCGIDGTGRSPAEIETEIAALRFDRRYSSLFPNAGPQDPSPRVWQRRNGQDTESVRRVTVVAADDMCTILRNEFGIPAGQIVLDEAGYDFRRSAESLRETLKVLGDRNLVNFGDRVPRIAIVVPALQGARAFLTFRQTGLTVVPVLTDYRVEPSRRPWPLHPQRRVYFRPDFLLFSAQSLAQSDAAWQEIKSLCLYALRLWIRPPLTDNRAVATLRFRNP
ncbi:MAG: hypothetical protein ACUVSQ_07590 [Pseudanabaenaceae cyanobacterium]